MADPQFMLHDFRWVLTALASPRFPPCHLPLVDSIIIDRGRPSLWLCLQSDGTVQQKPTASSSSQEIYNAFSAFSLGFPRNKARTVCAVHYAVGLPQVRGLQLAVFFLLRTSISPSTVFPHTHTHTHARTRALPAAGHGVPCYQH